MNSLLYRITVNVNVCKGKPSIRNMRFTVAQMLELIASGMTYEEILSDYPYLDKEDIDASLYYASQVLNNKDMFLLETAV